MVVYRLEKDGWGVFCSSISLNSPTDALYNNFGYTCSREYKFSSNWRSACVSLDKLIKYFGSDFAYVLGEGASIVAYDVPREHVQRAIGWRQIEVIFNVHEVKHRTVILKGEVSRWATQQNS